MKKLLLTILLVLAAVTAARAGDKFVAKSIPLNEGVWTSNYNLYLNTLFEYPDGIAETAQLTKLKDDDGNQLVTIHTTVTGVFSIIYESSETYRGTYTALRCNSGNYGDATVTVEITYNGETVSNTLEYRIYRFVAKDAIYDVNPWSSDNTLKPDTIDVLSSGSYANWNTDKTKISITPSQTELDHGSIRIVKGKDSYQVVEYTPNDDVQAFDRDSFDYTLSMTSGETSSAKATVVLHKNMFATKVLEYCPSPGQFRATEWDNPTNKDFDGNTGVSLGGFGGYIVFGFDQPIYNNPQNPYGVDFTVLGNSFVAWEKGVWTEPGAVQVMEDTNGNGIPDDGEWYELAGSDYWLSTTRRNIEMTYYNPNYNVRATIPWKTNDGEAGAMITNQFHQQPYYPDPYYNDSWYIGGKIQRDSMTYKGTLIRGCIDMRTPSYIEFYAPAAFGYFDNHGYNKDNPSVATNPYTTGGDGFDLNWAVDKDGNHVTLNKVDFVKVYTAGQKNAGWLGEWSSEVLGVAITRPDPDYNPEDIYINYAGITQLQVVKGHTCQYEGFLFKNGLPQADATGRWWVTATEKGDDTTDVGTIDQNGKFTGVNEGTAWIHYSAKDDIDDYSFEVEVDELTGISLSTEGVTSTQNEITASCFKGEIIYIDVQSVTSRTDTLNNTKSNRYIYDNYTWTNDNPEVGTIENGLFKALKAGTATLTVYSNTDNSITGTAVITVKENLPEATPIKETIYVTYNNPDGEYTNSDLFDADGSKATVYMEELKGEADVLSAFTLKNNHLYHKFESGKYGTYPVTFRTTCFGQEKEITINFVYQAPDTKATGRQIIVSDTEKKLESVSLDGSGLTVNGENFATTADNLVVDGAFVYTSEGAAASRYLVDGGEQISTTTLDSSLRHEFYVIEDKVLVSDGNKLKMLYRTDLTDTGNDVTFDGNIIRTAVNGSTLYALIDNAGAHSMASVTFDMNGFGEIKTVLASGKFTSKEFGSNNVSGFFILQDEDGVQTAYISVASDGENAIKVIFNQIGKPIVRANEFGGYEDEAPRVSYMDKYGFLYAAYGNGFLVYDCNGGDWDTVDLGNVMSVDDATPAYLTMDGADAYALYNRTDGGLVFKKYAVEYDDEYLIGITETASSEYETATASAATLMEAVDDNTAPTVAKDLTWSIYEMSSSAKTIYFTDASFSDLEGNTTLSLYARNIPEAYAEYFTYTRNASNEEANKNYIKIQEKTSLTCDAVTTFTIPVEAIDSLGASVLTNLTVKVTPYVYRPIIHEDKIVIYTQESAEATIKVSDIFEAATSSKVYYKGTTLSSDNEDLTAEASATTGDATITITAPTGENGTAYVTVTQILANTNYSSAKKKTFTAVIPVEYYDCTSSVSDLNADNVNVFIADATLHINGAEGKTARLYNTSGSLLATYKVNTERFTAPLSLNPGVYVVNVGTRSVKLIVR